MQRLLQALLDLPTPTYRHHRLVLGPDGKGLAGSSNYFVRIWDPETGRVARTLRGSGGNTTYLGLAISPDGQRVAAGGHRA